MASQRRKMDGERSDRVRPTDPRCDDRAEPPDPGPPDRADRLLFRGQADASPLPPAQPRPRGDRLSLSPPELRAPDERELLLDGFAEGRLPPLRLREAEELREWVLGR